MAPQPSVTIFVVDDDLSFRRSLSRLLKSAGYECEMFASAGEFLAAGRHPGAGCIILDVNMPGLSGLDLQAELARADYSLPIIFLTGHGDIPTSVRAMKGGAVDFLTKPVHDEDLLSAVKSALARDQQARQAYAEAEDARRGLALLTQREMQVLRHVIAGLLNKQIAAELGIVEKTVKVHRGRVMQKMRVNSVAELTRLAEKAGITPATPQSL